MSQYKKHKEDIPLDKDNKLITKDTKPERLHT